MKRFTTLEEEMGASPESFSEPERQFVRSVRRRYNANLELTAEQRDKIKSVWASFNRRRRAQE